MEGSRRLAYTLACALNQCAPVIVPTRTPRRVGFAIRYIAATVRQSLGPRDFATLVRGKLVNDFWELEPRPKDELHPEALAYHQHMCDVTAKMLFAGAKNAKPFQARSEGSSSL